MLEKRMSLCVVLAILVGLSGCGALPNNCPNGEISREDALRVAILRATSGHKPEIRVSALGAFLAGQPNCCLVQRSTSSLGGLLFDPPSIRTKYRITLNLRVADDGRLIHKYADMKINPCGKVINYKGDAYI